MQHSGSWLVQVQRLEMLGTVAWLCTLANSAESSLESCSAPTMSQLYKEPAGELWRWQHGDAGAEEGMGRSTDGGWIYPRLPCSRERKHRQALGCGLIYQYQYSHRDPGTSQCTINYFLSLLWQAKSTFQVSFCLCS